MSSTQRIERGGEASVTPLRSVAGEKQKVTREKGERSLSGRFANLGFFALKVGVVGLVANFVGHHLIDYTQDKARETLREPTEQLVELNKTAEELNKKADEIQGPVTSGADDLGTLNETAGLLSIQIDAFADRFGIDLPTTTLPETQPPAADQPG